MAADNGAPRRGPSTFDGAVMALQWRFRLAAAALAVALAAAPALAEGQQQRPAQKKSERAVVGLPVYTSDGKAIGRVVATGVDEDNRAVLVAEIERPLGLGLQAVAIPTDLFVRKRGRIELTLTQAEVNARLGR
jgi:hypothetical protein